MKNATQNPPESVAPQPDSIVQKRRTASRARNLTPVKPGAGETSAAEDPLATTAAEPVSILIERLNDCLNRYRTELRRTRRDFSNEYVHDLRVSIRRLIAAIEMGQVVIQKKSLKQNRRQLKSQLDTFDTLRDIQVQLTIVEELQEDLPEIAPYRDRLREREKRLIARLEKKVKDFRSTGLAQQVAGLRKSLRNKNIIQAESGIWSAIDEAYSVVIQRHFAVHADDTVTIHRLRLAFKKFRYMVESIHPLLIIPPENLLRSLHDYQTGMGEIQDVEVGLQLLAEFTTKSEADLPNVRAKLHEMHRARILNFIEDMNEVKTFWRSLPNKKFPWQLRKRTKKPGAGTVS